MLVPELGPNKFTRSHDPAIGTRETMARFGAKYFWTGRAGKVLARANSSIAHSVFGHGLLAGCRRERARALAMVEGQGFGIVVPVIVFAVVFDLPRAGLAELR